MMVLTFVRPFTFDIENCRLLRAQEKVVEVRAKGAKVEFLMKVGDAGEAFFVVETNVA